MGCSTSQLWSRKTHIGIELSVVVNQPAAGSVSYHRRSLKRLCVLLFVSFCACGAAVVYILHPNRHASRAARLAYRFTSWWTCETRHEKHRSWRVASGRGIRAAYVAARPFQLQRMGTDSATHLTSTETERLIAQYEEELSHQKFEPRDISSAVESQKPECVQQGSEFRSYCEWGEMKWSNGEKFIGEFKNGEPHGIGVWTDVDGDEWRGRFASGVPDGSAFVVTYTAGTKFFGPCSEFNVEGMGRWVTSSGFEYVGESKDHARTGRGKERYDDGYYEGDFVNQCREGMGAFYYNDGSVYKGQWENDSREGQGEFWERNALFYYKGEYGSNERCGQGSEWNENGAIYEGGWKNGKRHGEGKLWINPGEIFQRVVYLDGKQVSLGDRVIANGSHQDMRKPAPPHPMAIEKADVPWLPVPAWPESPEWPG